MSSPLFDPTQGKLALQQTSATKDPTTGIWYGTITATLPAASTPNVARNVPGTALWNAASPAVGGTSNPLILTANNATYKTMRVYLSITTGVGIQTVASGLQFSFDNGTSWYNYMQDNSVTPWLLTATSVATFPVLVCRDVVTTLLPTQIRLIALTVTALTGTVIGTVEYGG